MDTLARRAYDHQFRIDPIVRFLSDTDFYKLSMLQFIWKECPNVTNTFRLKNRTTSVKLSSEIDIEELRRQLDHVKTLRWTKQELNYLKAQEFYGKRDFFSPGFLDYLEHSWKLSDYELREEVDLLGVKTGQFELVFSGYWTDTTLWEIYGLTIINELRTRSLMGDMTKNELDIMFAQAKVKLYRKLRRLRDEPDGPRVSEFGTRRRFSHLWQDYVVQMMIDILGPQFVGTSNVYLSMKYGVNAVGTNAHELPMTFAALAKDDEALLASQYEVCRKWQNYYRGGMLIFLPDTFGTTQFLKGAPYWLAEWKGARPDSKKPIPGGEELIEFFREHGEDPKEKLIIFADGMDVAIDGFEPNGEDIITIHRHFKDRTNPTFGWGTMATNDFLGCHPRDPDRMKPISIVVKVDSADDRPAVKLSDNYTKATGTSPEEIARYRRVFGTEGMENVPVVV